MVKQIFNPYLPSWEYIPDGEPHVFGDRVYVYGSHDLANGWAYCLGDYVCWSASIYDLKEWRFEGVIYKKNQDPIFNGKMVMYAPDVTKGPDGRYYLYYVYDKLGIVSVAVCDTPAGKYEFYGYVHYKDGTRLGERKGDIPQFDPGLITEGEKTYLYTGFCPDRNTQRIGAMVTILGKDMVTIEEEPRVFLPGIEYVLPKEETISKLNKSIEETGCPYKMVDVDNWENYNGYAFFEASSIRKVDDTYYFIYSSRPENNELVYATSKSPTEGFTFRGVIVSNCDININTYKPANMRSYYSGNNHGGIEKINGEWYIFYHRHTNTTPFSRQACAEKIKMEQDGSIAQVEITSCGLNGGPLLGKGEYPAYIACHLFTDDGNKTSQDKVLKITQWGLDGEDGNPVEGVENAELTSYITGIRNNAVIGFKYFDFKDVKKVTVKTRAYLHGYFEVRTQWDGPVLGKIIIEGDGDYSNFWEEHSADISIPDGVSAFYLKYIKNGNEGGHLLSIKFE